MFQLILAGSWHNLGQGLTDHNYSYRARTVLKPSVLQVSHVATWPQSGAVILYFGCGFLFCFAISFLFHHFCFGIYSLPFKCV